FGLPTDFEGAATFTATGVDERISGTLVHEGGAHTVFTSALNLPGRNTAVILGTEGSIAIDGTWFAPTGYTVRNVGGELGKESRPQTAGRGMQYQALEVERLVAEGRTESERMPPEQSVGIMRTLDDI